MSSDQKKFPHVLIVGAGLGGLTLAQALRKQGISFEIFERDESITSRSAGWAIALHTILDELKQSVPADLPPIEETSHLIPLDLPAQLHFYAGDKQFLVEDSPGNPVIRCNRQKLREWLATNIDIRWGHKPVGVEHDKDSVRLRFEDGSEAVGDVLIGADGVKSQVRSSLLQDKAQLNPIPQGVIVGEKILDKEDFQKQLQLGHSAVVVIDPGFHIFVGLNKVIDDGKAGKYYWYVIWDDPDGGTKSHWTQTASKEQLYEFAVDKTKSLEPKFKNLIEKTKPEGMLAPPIIIQDLLLDSLPNTNVTLLGDAAHPMTPFRGEGGSHAMEDSLNLAKALIRSERSSLLPALKDYQDEMLQRARIAVEGSRHANDGGASGARKAWGQNLKPVGDN